MVAADNERSIKFNERDEYYQLLKEKHSQTNWNDLTSIKEYNEYVRQLRKLLHDEEDKK